jgi:hypothetical protein
MIGQLWHRVLCHTVVRNVQDFGVMEFSKHEDFAHVNITVSAIQIGEYNQHCGTTSIDLRQQTSLALLFQNLEQYFPWANHHRFLVGFEEILRDEPFLAFESPDNLLSKICDYLQEHKSLLPRPLFNTYNPGHGDITKITKLEITMKEDNSYSVETSVTTTQPGTTPNRFGGIDSDGTIETNVDITRISTSCDKLLEKCGKVWIPGLRIAVL